MQDGKKVGIKDCDWTIKVPIYLEWARLGLTGALLILGIILALIQ